MNPGVERAERELEDVKAVREEAKAALAVAKAVLKEAENERKEANAELKEARMKLDAFFSSNSDIAQVWLNICVMFFLPDEICWSIFMWLSCNEGSNSRKIDAPN